MAGLLGQATDWLGTRLNLPEMGISEFLGGGPTTNTYNYQAARGNVAGPVAPSYYQQSGTSPSGVLGTSTQSFSPYMPPPNPPGGQTFGDVMRQTGFNTGQSGAGPTANNPGGGNPDWNRLNQEDIQRSQEAERRAIEAAQQAYNAQNQQLNTQFDYARAQAEGQLGPLGTQKEQALGQVELGLGDVRRQVGTSKTNLATTTAEQIKQAGSTARNVQGQNRNVLRALGILNSSAAGQLLARPLNQFDEQRARLGQFLVQKFTELDDFVNQKAAEATQVKNSIVSNYNDLVNKIQTDLRFNDRQRNDALQAANAALSQRMSEISQAVMNYQNQAQQQRQQMLASAAQATNFQNPAISTAFYQTLGLAQPQRQTVATTLTEEQRRKQQGY